MAQQVEYGKPKRLNAVSATMLVLALGGGYWMWRFFPAYFDAWTVDHILRESATQVYRANRMQEPDRTNTLRDIVDKAKADMRKQAEIQDPDLTVGLNVDDANAILTADYTVRVTHPVLASPTVLHMHREEKADVKKVDWDKQ
jgi:hypothetical protein